MSRIKKCKKCDKWIAEEHWEFHQIHGHDVDGRFDKPADDDESRQESFVGFEKNLDASKNIGYPCREDGSYGSHASHDGFDDESWA